MIKCLKNNSLLLSSSISKINLKFLTSLVDLIQLYFYQLLSLSINSLNTYSIINPWSLIYFFNNYYIFFHQCTCKVLYAHQFSIGKSYHS